jgi:hypothetical protein
MNLTKPDGTTWQLRGANAKLSLRAGLPGARVFDLVADSLRKAKAAGLSTLDRLPLALPASWCVNSPADSKVLRRWALPPQRDVWLALVDVLEEARTGPLDAESCEAIRIGIQAIGPEAHGVEAISKVLALLVPEAVPLMPHPARVFVLGEEAASTNGSGFVDMVNWFGFAVEAGRKELESWASAHREVALDAAQVLDRLLWFDSEGYRHFGGAEGIAGS